jgi:predicted DNA-binding transcriptional regulator AlpA
MDTKDSYTIPEFCARNGISRSLLYKLWDEGKGPRRMSVGARTLISREAAEEWRRAREAEAVAEKREAA